MANPMYLTKDEQKMFEALAAKLKEGWDMKDEAIVFEDTPEKIQIRMRNMKIKDPQILALKDKVSSIKTKEEFASVFGTIDLSKIAQDDLIELYFAMGPIPFFTIIADSFKRIKTAEDVAALGSVATIRHGLLLSLFVPPVR